MRDYKPDISKWGKWEVPPTPALEVLERRVYANRVSLGEPTPAGRPKSGDPAFDAMLQKIQDDTA